MTNIVKYGGWDLEAVEADAAEVRKESSGTDFMKLQAGKNQVRFLPPRAGQTPYVRGFQHFVKIPGASDVSFMCPARMAKAACPACAKAKALEATGNGADRERAFEWRPSARFFANVIDRREPELGPKVLGFGKKIFESLVGLRNDADEGFDFSDPTEAGRDIVITKSGEGLKTRYELRASQKASALGNTDWIEQQAHLGRFVRVLSLEEILELWNPEGSSAPQQRAQQRAPVTQQRASTVVDVTGSSGFDDDDLPY